MANLTEAGPERYHAKEASGTLRVPRRDKQPSVDLSERVPDITIAVFVGAHVVAIVVAG
jgi:hypothetical protein